ncbi:unnamed protein product [Calicophoron daubneyi]|uniref:Uncharacterized protein n=1 Tax=Calicophoron daubneyi TaxID=300641 RepID=A0AAV2TGM8_CALDB
MPTKSFLFTHSFGQNHVIHIEQFFTLPLSTTVEDCFFQIVAHHNVPMFAHEVLFEKLREFIEQETDAIVHENYRKAVDDLVAGRWNLYEVCAAFDSAYKTHVSPYTSPVCATDEELFGQAYNRIIHSAAAQDLIHLEQSFALAVANEVDERNKDLRRLEEDLLAQTEMGLRKRGGDVSGAITQLQEDHFRARELKESQWDSCISELKRIQRRDLREFVMSVEEQMASCTDAKSATSNSCGQQIYTSRPSLSVGLSSRSSGRDKSSVSFTTPGTIVAQEPTLSSTASYKPWSESFTVQLGRQLRTTCEFRLIRADPMESLSNLGSSLSDSRQGQPLSAVECANDLAERLSNALSIYSNNLNGLVIVVDKQINSFCGIKRRLAEACERSTEFHFPELGCQLADIQDTVNRLGCRSTGNSPASSCSLPEKTTCASVKSDTAEPVQGDVYITKHSNLAGGIGGLAGGGGGITVVFHLVQDESLDRGDDRFRSGSSLHCALSAILRICFDYDITTLSLPLLLVQSLREQMDESWRARRAEAVFKALKGALMELSTWRGPVVRSIQFLAPPQLSDDELSSFGQIITGSFLQPIPLVIPG